jgi:diguanylate cyclase (GGDEF)-like protein
MRMVELFESLKAALRLPTAPGVALRLVELTRSDEVPPDALVELIGLDPALSARLLRTANSSSGGEAQALGSLRQAAERIGPGGVTVLALSFSPAARAKDACYPGFDLTRFWERSLARALAASAVAERTQSVDAGEAYAAGLLCGMGRFVLAAADDGGLQVARRRRTEAVDVRASNHLEVATQLFDAWQLPPRICDAIAASAETGAGDSKPPLAHVLFVADSIARQLCDSTEKAERPFAEDATTWSTRASPSEQPPDPGSLAKAIEASYAALGIPAGQGNMLFDDVWRRWRNRRQILAIPANSNSSCEQIDAQARERLGELALESQRQLHALVQQQDELLRRARTDPLTAVGNRPAFDERFALELDRAQRTGRPVVLLLADVDRFKEINDRNGHAAGDAVLRQVARTLDDETRSVDLVARYGGDEFAVIAPECTLAGASKLAERLRIAVEQVPLQCNGRRIRVTISIGAALAEWPNHTATPDSLFAAADEQLYSAKHAGRNCTRVRHVTGEAVPPPHMGTKRVDAAKRRADER